jgi:hypothetical protein
MTTEWVTALAAVGTFLVIAASAIAALLQLRHLRSGNAISLLTAYNTEFDTLEFQTAFAYVRSELPEQLMRESVLDELAKAPPFLGDHAKIRTIANFFEDMGAFVLAGLLSRDIVCNLYGENVLSAWQTIAPVAALVRHRTGRPGIWENFEYLASLSDDFFTRHPGGVYPRGVRRMPVDSTLVQRWQQQQLVSR